MHMVIHTKEWQTIGEYLQRLLFGIEVFNVNLH